MKRFVAIGAVLGSALLARSGLADAPGPLARLFRQQADIVVLGPDAAWVELDLPPEVLRSCRADLADVRVLDAAQAEVPFAIETKASRDDEVPKTDLYPVAITAIQDRTSRQVPMPGGTTKTQVRETYQLLVPEEARRQVNFELVLQSKLANFVRTVSVVALDPPSRTLASHVSIFRLTANGAFRDRVPLAGAPGAKLSVTIEGEEAGFLDPTFALDRSRPPVVVQPPLVVKLETVRTVAEGGRTEITVARPAGIVPTAVNFATVTALFDRRVTIVDEGGPRAGAVLGTGVLCGGTCSGSHPRLRVEIAAARGDGLRIAIEDGDSPALAQVSIDAIVLQPALRIPSAALQGGHGTLLFGSSRVRAPVYDLALLATPPADGAPDSRPGRLERVRDNDAFDTTPALGWAMHAGAKVDVGTYRFARRVEMVPSADGLSRVVLGAEEVAAARSDLADIRIVDQAGAQWPYLLERDPHGRWLTLVRGASNAVPRSTRVEFALPARPLAVDALVLDIRDPYFHRPYHLSGLDPNGDNGQELHLLDGELARDAGGEVRAIEVPFAAARVANLVLEIDDGDDAPLDVRSAQARMAQPVLYVAAPAGSYSVVTGNVEGAPPSYDLQKARDTVLTVESTVASLGRFAPNPSFRAMARLAAKTSFQDIALWAALIAATLVLGGLTLRLARAPDAPPDEGKS